MTQPNISRRNMIRLAAGFGAISTTFATTGLVARAASHAGAPMQGSVTIHKLGPVTLHSYMAPEASALVTTHIIETPNALHIIDAQFLQVFGAEARAYADSLGKPIAQLYLSHAHPDHILGAAQFADVPFVTSDAVRKDAEANADMFAGRKAQFDDTTELYLPDGGLGLGQTDWDGVEVRIAEVKDAEAPVTLTFHIPEAGLVIAQDLLYADAHAFPLGNTENWKAGLRAIGALEGLKVIGAGHGLPAAPGALDDAVAYLEFREEVIAASAGAEAAVAALSEAYPNYGAELILSFVGYRYQ